MKYQQIAISLLALAVIKAEVPDELSVLTPDQMVKGAIMVVVPPPELDAYVTMVEAAARQNPVWFAEHSKKASPGVPLPFDPKLGLSREDYDEYLRLWDAREFKEVEPVVLSLKSDKNGMWSITATGGAQPISTLKYDPKQDVILSPNGQLERLEDVKANKRSILGEWSGSEWRFEEETSLGRTKENFAVGATADKKFGLVVYRMQEISAEGTRLYDKSMVVRFPMGKAGIIEPKSP